MGMDDEWKKVFDERASKDMAEHEKGYWTKKGYKQLLRVTLRIARKLKGVRTVLDVGCGTGRYCGELSAMGFDVTGVDYSEKLVELARQLFPKASFVVGNGYSLPFRDKGFDLVLSIGALQVVENHERFIAELCRVAKKHVVMSTLYSHRKKDLGKHLQEMLKDDPWPTREYHPEDLTPLLEKSGFSFEVITHEGKERIRDGFFIIATRKG